MEQARYWMWAKKKPDPNQHILAPSSAAMNSYGDSWEEQAFAEDAAGTLGGCVWPPRSYSCSFCRREFKSAQALGGHMNVHRRDRARLKQSSNSPSDFVPQNHALSACTTSSFDAVIPNYSSQVCTFLYNNPNPDQFSDIGPLHGLRVSSPPPINPTKVHYSDENISTLCFFSPLHAHKDDVRDSPRPPSWSSFLSDKRDVRDFDSKKRPGDHQDTRAHDKEDCVTDDHLSMSLNLQRKTSSDEEVASCKRRRIEAKPMSFLTKLSGVERCFPQSDVLKICSVAGTVDELDLELRLGNAPKVK